MNPLRWRSLPTASAGTAFQLYDSAGGKEVSRPPSPNHQEAVPSTPEPNNFPAHPLPFKAPRRSAPEGISLNPSVGDWRWAVSGLKEWFGHRV